MRRYTEQINGKWVITAERDNTIAASCDGNKLKSVSGASIDHFAKLEDKIENGELVDRNEYERVRHRAEVAERAFDNTMKVFYEILSAIFPDTKIDLDEWKKNNLANAEKELAEEG